MYSIFKSKSVGIVKRLLIDFNAFKGGVNDVEMIDRSLQRILRRRHCFVATFNIFSFTGEEILNMKHK